MFYSLVPRPVRGGKKVFSGFLNVRAEAVQCITFVVDGQVWVEQDYFICQSICSANSRNFMWFNLKFSCHFHILSKICMVVKRSVFHDILLREDYLHLYSLIFPVKHIFLKGNISANVLIYSELGTNLHLLLFL